MIDFSGFILPRLDPAAVARDLKRTKRPAEKFGAVARSRGPINS